MTTQKHQGPGPGAPVPSVGLRLEAGRSPVNQNSLRGLGLPMGDNGHATTAQALQDSSLGLRTRGDFQKLESLDI